MRMKKIFIALFLALLFAGAGFYTHSAEGSHGGNVMGWLWGGSTDENLTNCGSGINGLIDCGGIGWIKTNHGTEPFPSYGLNIPLTAPSDVTGYAWSSNVGWIDFQPGGTPPANPSTPGVQRVGNDLVGWARIISIKEAFNQNNSGGWEGWVKLSGATTGGGSYGVTINPATGALAGHAWSNELGWIDFSRASIPASGSPSCTLSANPTNGPSPLSGTLSWVTQNDPTSCVASGGWSGNKNPAGSGNTPAPYGPISDTTTYSLTCSNATVQSGSCQTTVIVTGLTISCSGSPNPAPLSGGSATVNWTGSILSPGTPPYNFSWVFDNGAVPPNASIPAVSVSYTTAGRKTATLTVTDRRGITDSHSCEVIVGKKGTWREILPFL